MTGIVQLVEIAKEAAIRAGIAVMDIYRSAEFFTEWKPGNSPVTAADKKAHEIICEHLSKTKLPVLSEESAHADYPVRRSWDYFWLVDPLDGTKEFIQKNGEFTINIALVKKNFPVAGVIYVPVQELLYVGAAEAGAYKIDHGFQTNFTPLSVRKKFNDLLQKESVNIAVSRSHASAATLEFLNRFKQPRVKTAGSALKFMMLAEGEADVYCRLEPCMEWDTAAAHAILHACNRGVYTVDLTTELSYNKPDLHSPFFIAF